jgi:peptidoglycan/xylan/chitin deacetylase (PgdA/CDA1 family)
MNALSSRGRRTGTAAAILALAATVTFAGSASGSPPSSVPKLASASPAVTYPAPSGLGGANWDAVKTGNKVVALTFDGGSGAEAVDSILSTLGAQHVPATFFLTGNFVRDFPVKARAIVAAGERVGDHSVSHPHFIGEHLTDAQMRAQVRDARQQIISATGADPWPWFRFPYGDLNAHAISVVNSVGFVPIGWTVDTLGWKGAKDTGVTESTIVNRVVANLKPGEIVLMHVGAAPDGTTLDAAALPSIISALTARGYSFVTMDAMLGYRILTSNGGMRAFGSASFGTAAGKLGTGVTATAIAASRKTGGYLILKSDGGVHAFARSFYGSDAGQLSPGVTARGLAIDTSTGGYWILRSDGQVDAFNAPALGGLADLPSGVRPTGIAAAADGGYYVLTSDGDVHGFGTASRGSLLGKLPAGRTAVGIAADGATGGYWILTSNGGVSSFKAPWWGSLAGKLTAHQSVTGITGQ